MPTSLISEVTLVNLGAVTTTFTLPTGCRDNTDYQVLAATDFPQRPLYNKQCDPSEILTIGTCLPNGAKLDEYVKEQRDANRHYTAMFYHSPGNVCPQGWNTVGVAQKDDNGSLSVEGIFAATEFSMSTSVMTTPPYQPRPNYIAAALDDSETAIYCCPSDLTADPLDGGCKGTTAVESYTESTGCAFGYQLSGGSAAEETYTYNDIVVTQDVPVAPTGQVTISVLQSIELVASRTQSSGEIDATRTAFATSEFVGFTDIPAVILVNKGEKAEEGDGEGEGDEGNGATESGGTGNDNGSAASGRASLMWGGGCMMAVFWGVCLLL